MNTVQSLYEAYIRSDAADYGVSFASVLLAYERIDAAKCGRGWVGYVGNCKRAKSVRDMSKAQRRALANEIRGAVGLKPVEEVNKGRKQPNQDQPQKSKPTPAPGDAKIPPRKDPKTDNKIRSMDEFKSAIVEAASTSTSDFVSLKDLRKQIGDRVSDDLFNKAIKKMYKDGDIKTGGPKNTYVVNGASKLREKRKKEERKKQKESGGHKPMMTKRQADEYTKDSAYANIPLYHGTTKTAARSITSDGVDMDKNKQAIYGKGFYIAKDSMEAEDYAFRAVEGQGASPSEAVTLEMRVNIKNPRIFKGRLDYDQYLQENDLYNKAELAAKASGRKKSDHLSEMVTESFKKEGFDGVEIGELGYIVAFDPNQVVTVTKPSYKL